MHLLERVRGSSSASWGVAVGAYLISTAGAMVLRKTTGGSQEGLLAGAALLSAGLVVTALIVKTGFPRWSLLAASGFLALALVATPLIAPGMAPRGHDLLGAGGYAWIYLMLLGGTRAAGPRWCHSPWVAVGSSLVLAVGWVFAQGIS